MTLQYRIDRESDTIEPRQPMARADWDRLLDVMAEAGVSALKANGQADDAALAKIAARAHVLHLDLGGCRRLTDAGLRSLARMRRLQSLDLSGQPGGPITDRGLDVLGQLPELRSFRACWQSGISDAGIGHLAACDRIERVDLMGTSTGDGALRTLAGKRRLRHLTTGRLVTDAGLALLHEIPAFRSWQGGDLEVSLMRADAGPTYLLLDGPFTDRGVASLAGLDGLSGLGFFWHLGPDFTPAGLAALSALPRLGFLGCEGTRCDDEAMRHIAALPALRMLMAQGTVATDDGFATLARSRTLEYLWGRECPSLTGRGFAALATLPALRGLAVSCRNVSAAALATLSSFPALRELMPMDVADDGFVHVGRCTGLEALWCMYCRDTTDAATDHLTKLDRLTTYYAGRTRITDRSLETLGGLASLESIELWQIEAITDAGVARLADLPRLRQLRIDGSPRVTREVLPLFPASVSVDVAP